LSLVFIIDNSASMDENDPRAARFDVVAGMLDTLFSIAPTSEVGLVIFTRRLSFDHRDNPFFARAFPSDTSQHDSYVPLTPLNRAFADGRIGLDTLKAFLRHDAMGNLVHGTRLPASRRNPAVGPANTRDGTDITLGFEAAKAALRDSRAEPGDRFLVFLSDGTPAIPDIGREALADDFIAGTGVPATFTIYFDTRNSIPAAPGTILDMTANIRNNGYSETNRKSAYWAINEPGGQLERVLRENVLGNVISVATIPREARLSAGDSLYRSADLAGKEFVFARALNLKADTTRIEVGYTYAYLDSSQGAPQPAEKRTSYALTLVRSAGMPPLPEDLRESCREQPEIGLFRDGLPISEVTVDDAQLEARVIPSGGAYCGSCRLEALPSGPARDLEALPLGLSGPYLEGTLRPVESPLSAPGDGLLQHGPADSIVIRYVDPENPLDVVRKAYPYRPAPAALDLRCDSGVVRLPAFLADPLRPQFALSAPAAFLAAARKPGQRWRPEPAAPAPPASAGGVVLEASRAFTVDLNVYSNRGDFVNRLEFTVGPDAFERMEPVPGGRKRRLRLFWDGRARNGGPVGTGVYILKTTIRLLPVPGLPGGAEKTEYRRVGVLRSY
jgi:hypothetical protein